jgi:hypothetical protein
LRASIYTPATDVHHLERHNGNLLLFLTSPLESLCHICHSRKTANEVFRNRQNMSGKAMPQLIAGACADLPNLPVK